MPRAKRVGSSAFFAGVRVGAPVPVTTWTKRLDVFGRSDAPLVIRGVHVTLVSRRPPVPVTQVVSCWQHMCAPADSRTVATVRALPVRALTPNLDIDPDTGRSGLASAARSVEARPADPAETFPFVVSARMHRVDLARVGGNDLAGAA